MRFVGMLFGVFLSLGVAMTPAVPALVAAKGLPPIGPPTIGPNGLHFQPWFKKTTGDLRRDLFAAKGEGKVMVLLWEQEGCVYCKKMHEITFRIPEIVDYIKKNFYVMQMDMRGKRRFTDLKGKAVAESKLARELRITGTPTSQFLNSEGREIFRMPGYAEPVIFNGVYEYVANEGYKTAPLGAWLKEHFTKKAGGTEKTVN